MHNLLVIVTYCIIKRVPAGELGVLAFPAPAGRQPPGGPSLSLLITESEGAGDHLRHVQMTCSHSLPRAELWSALTRWPVIDSRVVKHTCSMCTAQGT